MQRFYPTTGLMPLERSPISIDHCSLFCVLVTSAMQDSCRCAFPHDAGMRSLVPRPPAPSGAKRVAGYSWLLVCDTKSEGTKTGAWPQPTLVTDLETSQLLIACTYEETAAVAAINVLHRYSCLWNTVAHVYNMSNVLNGFGAGNEFVSVIYFTLNARTYYGHHSTSVAIPRSVQ